MTEYEDIRRQQEWQDELRRIERVDIGGILFGALAVISVLLAIYAIAYVMFSFG